MECGNEKDSHSALGKGNGAVRIDWERLIKSMCSVRGDIKALHAEMESAHVVVGYDAMRNYVSGKGKRGQPRGDAAVWLVDEARRRGLDIPTRPLPENLRYIKSSPRYRRIT